MAIELLHRKESVILTVIDIIDQLGIQGLSTREIAKRQGISEGTLFRHFRTKNEIMLAVLEYFSKFDADIFKSTSLKGMKSEEAILYYVSTYATYYQNYPAITAITQLYGMLGHEPSLADKVQSILKNRMDFLVQLIEKGQQTGEIRPDIDSSALADLINGVCGSICLRWRLAKYTFPLYEKTMAAVEMLLDAFCLRPVNKMMGGCE